MFQDIAFMVLGYVTGTAWKRWRGGWYTRYNDARRMRQTGWWQKH